MPGGDSSVRMGLARDAVCLSGPRHEMPNIMPGRSAAKLTGAPMKPNRLNNLETHNFVLVLDGSIDPDGGIEDTLFEAGCDDGILAFRNGVAYLEFDREADSLEAAILSAVRDVEGAECNLTVSHVEPDDVVNASEIARRLQCSREYVRLLVRGSRGEGGFPSPLAGVTGKTCLWSWANVLHWLLEQKKIANSGLLSKAELIRDINSVLLNPTTQSRQRHLRHKLQGT